MFSHQYKALNSFFKWLEWNFVKKILYHTPPPPSGAYTGRSKSRHIKIKVVINCIAVNIIISPTARWYSRMHC
jgi:hypothetical protein